MSFEEFDLLFQNALLSAASVAKESLKKDLPARLIVELHGAGYSGESFDVSEAARILYLGEERFYRVIDVAVIKVGRAETTIFVRASSHTPGTFEQTWNTPPGSGPFKQLISQKITLEETNN